MILTVMVAMKVEMEGFVSSCSEGKAMVTDYGR